MQQGCESIHSTIYLVSRLRMREFIPSFPNTPLHSVLFKQAHGPTDYNVIYVNVKILRTLHPSYVIAVTSP
jgi:hypothetical protein